MPPTNSIFIFCLETESIDSGWLLPATAWEVGCKGASSHLWEAQQNHKTKCVTEEASRSLGSWIETALGKIMLLFLNYPCYAQQLKLGVTRNSVTEHEHVLPMRPSSYRPFLEFGTFVEISKGSPLSLAWWGRKGRRGAGKRLKRWQSNNPELDEVCQGKDTKRYVWRKNWGRRGMSDLAGEAKGFWNYVNIL